MDPIDPVEAIHCEFELSYAAYLVIPRTVLQSMPSEWQVRFVRMMREIRRTIDEEVDLPEGTTYVVHTGYTKDSGGTHCHCENHDPLADYERGRRRLPLKEGMG